MAWALALSLAAPGVALAQGGARAKAAAKAAPKAAVDPAESLRAAYQREFAFLIGQRRQLKERLARVKRDAAGEQTRAEGQLSGLESRLLGAQDRLKRAREALTVAQQAQQSSADDGGLVQTTLEQSKTTLKDYPGVSLAAPEGDKTQAAQLAGRFSAAGALLGRLSGLRSAPGAFFGADGRKLDGSILRLGPIAAYGVAEGAAGMLAPAGGGRLKLWPQDDQGAAQALAAGRAPALLPVFLFERLDLAVQEDKAASAVEHVDSGGAIAWVIVGLGLVGLLLVSARAWILWRASSDLPGLEASVRPAMVDGEFAQARAQLDRQRGAPARVLGAVLDRLQVGDPEVEDVVSEQLLREERGIERFGAVILVIAAVAPLLGLLGTVTGMISTFDIITKFGTGDPKLLSGGISTALVTTELGLIVAIPTLMLGNLLKGWAERVEADIERAVLRALNAYRQAQNPDAPGRIG